MRTYTLNSKDNTVVLSDDDIILEFKIIDSVMYLNNDSEYVLNVYCEGAILEERVHVFIFNIDTTEWYSSTSFTREDIMNRKHLELLGIKTQLK